MVDTLIRMGAEVRVADDFSSGRLGNFVRGLKRIDENVWGDGELTVYEGDLKEKPFTRTVMKDEVVFHLAACHGGRGNIHTHPADCASNMALDEIVFEEACKSGVERICFASSACVYPRYLQEEAGSSYRLKEDDADPFVRDKAQADLEYGWAKLMGEMALKAYHRQHGLKCASVRIFTAYGPRENETRAIIAVIAKAYVRMEPFVIWGSGRQDRNFTYVQDAVDAMIFAAEKITDGSPVNAGREDRITIDGAVELIFDLMGWRPSRIEHDPSKPEGVTSRAADLTRARDILGWEPKVSYLEGFKTTIDWYSVSKDKREVAVNLNRFLMER